MRIDEYGVRKKRWYHFFQQLSVEFLTDRAGKFTVGFSLPIRFLKNALQEYNTINVFYFYFHLFPIKHHIKWGYSQDWYDGPLHDIGFGRLALFCWSCRPILVKE